MSSTCNQDSYCKILSNLQLEDIYMHSKGINIVDMKNTLVREESCKSIVSSEEKELCIFLYTILQFYLEKAVKLMNLFIKIAINF